MPKKSDQPWWVYILQSTVNGHLYTGIALDVDKRLAKHNSGRGAKYTRKNGPWVCVYRSVYPSVGDAMREERRIKSLPRSRKLLLIHQTKK